METSKFSIAKRLKEARGDRSQVEVSRMLGISQPVLCKIEAGLREPTAYELWRLAQFYQKPVSSFFEKEGQVVNFVAEDMIEYDLSHYGYGSLVVRKGSRQHTPMPVEDLIINILHFAPDPRFLQALPVILYLNEVDTDKLYSIAIIRGLQNRLGFILEMSQKIFQKEELKKLLSMVSKMKLARENSFVEDVDKLSVSTLKYLRSTRDPIAKKWNMLDRLYLEGFKEAFQNAILAKTA